MERFRHPIMAFAGGPQAIGSRIMCAPFTEGQVHSASVTSDGLDCLAYGINWSLPKVGSTRVYRAVPPK